MAFSGCHCFLLVSGEAWPVAIWAQEGVAGEDRPREDGTHPLTRKGHLWVGGDGELGEGLGSLGLPHLGTFQGQRDQCLEKQAHQCQDRPWLCPQPSHLSRLTAPLGSAHPGLAPAATPIQGQTWAGHLGHEGKKASEGMTSDLQGVRDPGEPGQPYSLLREMVLLFTNHVFLCPAKPALRHGSQWVPGHRQEAQHLPCPHPEPPPRLGPPPPPPEPGRPCGDRAGS